MPKKPTLTIADPKSDTALSPPTTLGKTGAALWQTIMNEYRIADSGGCEMLVQICKAADRADECAEEIVNDGGPVIRTKHGLRGMNWPLAVLWCGHCTGLVWILNHRAIAWDVLRAPSTGRDSVWRP